MLKRGAQKKIPLKNYKLPRSHYTLHHNKWKAKKQFTSEEEADAYIYRHHLKEYSSYLCPQCNKYHIGHKFKKL